MSANVQIFPPSHNGQVESINKYLNKLSIFPVDITQFGTNFNPSKLDLFGLEKNTMADEVVKYLK